MALVIRFIVVLIVFFIAYETIMVLRMWFQARMTQTPVRLRDIAQLQLGSQKAQPILKAFVTAHQAQLDVPLLALKELQILGGDVEVVVREMIRAKAKGEPVSFDQAANHHLSLQPSPVFHVITHNPDRTKKR